MHNQLRFFQGNKIKEKKNYMTIPPSQHAVIIGWSNNTLVSNKASRIYCWSYFKACYSVTPQNNTGPSHRLNMAPRKFLSKIKGRLQMVYDFFACNEKWELSICYYFQVTQCQVSSHNQYYQPAVPILNFELLVVYVNKII